MIPHDRPFIGRDLEDFRLRFGFTVDQICFVCGLTRNRWFLMTSKEKDLPIRDVPLAIMCRLIDENTELMFVPEFISPQELMARLKEANYNVTQREFSILMGNNATSANRWTAGRKGASPNVRRLSHVVSTLVDAVGPETAMNQVRDLVLVESLNRGIRDIFKEGRWTVQSFEDKRYKSPSAQKGQSAAE